MAEIVGKLLTVKSIVTLVLTLVFAYLAIAGQIGADLYMTIYTVVISFYFGVQYAKGGGAKNEEG